MYHAVYVLFIGYAVSKSTLLVFLGCLRKPIQTKRVGEDEELNITGIDTYPQIPLVEVETRNAPIR